MENQVEKKVLHLTGGSGIDSIEIVQKLWSGYGKICKYKLIGADVPSVIVKHVIPPSELDHPRGWHSDFAHQRKLNSYQVEMNWYQHWASYCTKQARVPQILWTEQHDNSVILIMEDLDASGFDQRRQSLSIDEIKNCLHWLAHFHAIFMQHKATGLWPIGTYWHLDTRPDEWSTMTHLELKQAAHCINDRLEQCKYQTFVHGDAKVANFCFSSKGKVAAVDFQYVGSGCGIKDVVYFLGSCLDNSDCEKYCMGFLDDYFIFLFAALRQRNFNIDFVELETQWRELFPWAWADFYRFLNGWKPDHFKINTYMCKLTNQVLQSIAQNNLNLQQ